MTQFSFFAVRLWQKIVASRALVPIMASVCVVGTGNSLLTTAVSLDLSRRPDIAAHVVQLLLTAFPIGFLAGCLLAQSLVSRLGHQRTFLMVSLLAAVAALGFTATTAFPAWFCLRLLNGLSMATLFIVSESWINLYADQRNRGSYFSLYMMMTSLAVLFGQLLIELAGAHSPHLFLIAAVAISLGWFYCKFLGGRWPALPLRPHAGTTGVFVPDQRYGLWKLARPAPVTIIAVFQAGMTNMNVFAMTPIYGAQMGLAASTTVGLVTAFSIGGMLAQTPVGWLSDRLDRRVMLLVQGILTAALCAAIVWTGDRYVPLLYILFLAYGVTALTIYPVGIAFANSQLESRHMVSASGGLLLLYSIGNVITPGAAAGLMAHIAPQALFVMLGSGAVLVALAACFNLPRRVASVPVAPPQECLMSGVNE
jgi:MFS family permease